MALHNTILAKFLRRSAWLAGASFFIIITGNVVLGQNTDGSIDKDTTLTLSKPEAPAPAPGNRVTNLSVYDKILQVRLKDLLREQNLLTMCRQERLAVSVADICDLDNPRYAGVNDHVMMYAASLPKIAVLLTAFEMFEQGKLPKTQQNIDMLTMMIRHSSNVDASRAIAKVGFATILKTMRDPRYRFYEPGIGGLWIGKAFSKARVWRRDPLKNTVHGATSNAAVRFYYMLERGELVNPQASKEMKAILGNPGINHKFVKGMSTLPGPVKIYRKSGTWKIYQSDSALIKHNGHTYVVAALAESSRGESILQNLIVGIDRMIDKLHEPEVGQTNGK
jgi:beta-lactamase class A